MHIDRLADTPPVTRDDERQMTPETIDKVQVVVSAMFNVAKPSHGGTNGARLATQPSRDYLDY